MDLSGIPAVSPPVPPIRTPEEYEAATARLWVLVETPLDLPHVLALRESMRLYEHAHPAHVTRVLQHDHPPPATP